MSATDHAAVFDSYRTRLQDVLAENDDITSVEHVIDSYALDSEEKAALWLWAIAPRDRSGNSAANRRLAGARPGPVGPGSRRHARHEGGR